ncbi:MAG: 50S ribosomal protein L6 [Chloroflexi bacterium]|nr:50S ribosomal protein L6 [Chloroflexota bacterium]
MSRIGKQPITVPSSVTLDVAGDEVRVKGPKGELSRRIPPAITLRRESDTVFVERATDSNTDRSLHGLTRTLVANMVTGVSEGFTRRLEINGVGYRAATNGTMLTLQVGFSHPVIYPAPAGVTFAVQGNALTISGSNKEQVGEIAAQIRRVRPPEPYKGKGIKYAEEVIRRKAGKAGSKKK